MITSPLLTPTFVSLSENGKLQMELRVSMGRGYVSADKNFDEDMGIGYIPIDSVHSPVRRVNYHVEAARIGQATDYDRLVLEIWTNGTVTTEMAAIFLTGCSSSGRAPSAGA